MHDERTMREARRLLEQRNRDRVVGRAVGVPATTVGRWRRGESAGFGEPVVRLPWRPPHDGLYAYLLGTYLGDGHVQVRPRGRCWLRIFLDGIYPEIVDEVRTAVGITSWGQAVGIYDVKDSRCVFVQCQWREWPEAFPQHGPGRKHERPIVLADWQEAIVAEHPGLFVRGLIHSDGCRTINRFSTTLPSGRVAEYAYPRYFFSNLSPDIRRLFGEACDRLGVRWTMSNARNVSVSHRRSVAILDEHVGPKA